MNSQNAPVIIASHIVTAFPDTEGPTLDFLFSGDNLDSLPPGIVAKKMKAIDLSEFLRFLKSNFPDLDLDALLPVDRIELMARNVVSAFFSVPVEDMDVMTILFQSNPFAFSLAAVMMRFIPFPKVLNDRYYVARFRAYFQFTRKVFSDHFDRETRLGLFDEYFEAIYDDATEYRSTSPIFSCLEEIRASVHFRKVGPRLFGFVMSEPNRFLVPSNVETITQYAYIEATYDMVGKEMPPKSSLTEFCNKLGLKFADELSMSKQDIVSDLIERIVANNGDDYFWTDRPE